jgi:general secretion pathway protein D
MNTRFAGVIAMLLGALVLAQEPAQKPQVTTASEQRKLGSAHFEIDQDSKTLIVTTDEETNETIKRIIAELDRPVPQALINVMFIEVTYGDDLDFGTELGYSSAEANGNSRSITSLFNLEGITQGGAVALVDGDLTATLKALSTKTKMELLSRPSIMARNNEESTITIGSEVPFIKNSQVTDDGRVLNTVEYEDIGIILTVTPHINGDGMVELEVAPEISAIAEETVQISDSVTAPTFAKRSAETHVVVPNGKTVVIGGLMEDKDRDEVRKVPVLGDIPLVGRLFRRTIKAKDKTELLVFLTPHVVVGKTATTLTEPETKRSGLPESVDAAKLQRYLGSNKSVVEQPPSPKPTK